MHKEQLNTHLAEAQLARDATMSQLKGFQHSELQIRQLELQVANARLACEELEAQQKQLVHRAGEAERRSSLLAREADEAHQHAQLAREIAMNQQVLLFYRVSFWDPIEFMENYKKESDLGSEGV